MSKLRGVLELDVPTDRALVACRQALKDLGWDVVADDANVLVAEEDPTRLACHCSPAKAKLRVDRGDHGAAIAIETTVPGFGPISSSQVREREAAVVRRIHAHAISFGQASATLRE